MKKVSAATITSLTAAAGFAATAASAPPSVDDLLARMRAKNPRQAKEFEALAAALPQGFALVPVLYTRVPRARQASMESEYTFSVRQRFLKFLGQTQQPALRALGICEHGIARMARGLDPATVTGERYDVNIDHIIERCGSGTITDSRRRDELRGDAQADTYPVNHFNNLLLLPQDIHDYKNRLNSLQNIGALGERESCWILMLTPQASAQHPGYVCPPQPQERSLGRLALRHPSVQQQIGETKTVALETLDTMQALVADTAAGSILAMLEQLARRHRPSGAGRKRTDNDKKQRVLDDKYLRAGRTVADLGVTQPRESAAANSNAPPGGENARPDVPSAPNTLRAIFNAAVSHDRAAQAKVEDSLRPRLRELTVLLDTAYQRVRALEIATPGHRSYQEFTGFFRGRNLRALCLEASHYPLAESRDLLAVYRRIDGELRQREYDAKRLEILKKTA